MTQTVDPIKLKAAAEHLEWVLKQYPDSGVVQNLLHALMPLIDAAKTGVVFETVEKIPCMYNFADGVYRPYEDPSVDEAYVAFSIEMRGGLTEQEKQLNARFDSMRSKFIDGSQP